MDFNIPFVIQGLSLWTFLLYLTVFLGIHCCLRVVNQFIKSSKLSFGFAFLLKSNCSVIFEDCNFLANASIAVGVAFSISIVLLTFGVYVFSILYVNIRISCGIQRRLQQLTSDTIPVCYTSYVCVHLCAVRTRLYNILCNV